MRRVIERSQVQLTAEDKSVVKVAGSAVGFGALTFLAPKAMAAAAVVAGCYVAGEHVYNKVRKNRIERANFMAVAKIYEAHS